MLQPIYVKKRVIEDTLKYKGEILLTYQIEYPEFSACRYQNCLLKVNEFYKERALKYKKYCETDLFAMAVEQYKEAIKNNFPVRIFEAMMVYKVTYSSACIISAYFDKYEYTGGAHGNTIRDSQTWNLKSCSLVKLYQLITCPPDFKSYVLAAAELQIKTNPEIYFENYSELLDKSFNENSFYCNPFGIVVFYQQYDIAPYSSGIREFFIPYSECVKNPNKFCRMS